MIFHRKIKFKTLIFRIFGIPRLLIDTLSKLPLDIEEKNLVMKMQKFLMVCCFRNGMEGTPAFTCTLSDFLNLDLIKEVTYFQGLNISDGEMTSI